MVSLDWIQQEIEIMGEKVLLSVRPAGRVGVVVAVFTSAIM